MVLADLTESLVLNQDIDTLIWLVLLLRVGAVVGPCRWHGVGQDALEVVLAQVELTQPGEIARKGQNVGGIFTVKCRACGERKLGDVWSTAYDMAGGAVARLRGIAF